MRLKPRQTGAATAETTTHFLNVDVDLDLVGPADLTPFVRALEPVHVIQTPAEPRYRALVEVEGAGWKIDCRQTIRAFLDRTEKLDADARALWQGCASRTFDIGLASGVDPRYAEYLLDAHTVRRLAAVDATIKITIYGARRR